MSKKKMPLIGVSGSLTWETSGTFAKYPKAYVNHDYILSVTRAGGVPVILPFNDNDEAVKEMVSHVDGLLLSGGHDVWPKNYGEEPMQGLGDVWPERDHFDFLLLKEAKKRGIPIFAVCRGHQIVNVAYGGSLYQDLKYDEKCYIKHFQNQRPDLATHSVDITEDTIFAKTVKMDEMMVNTFHHQHVKTVGDGLKVTSVAKDGVIESLEAEDYPWLATFQFHPEMMTGTCEEAAKLFEAFIKEAKKGASQEQD